MELKLEVEMTNEIGRENISRDKKQFKREENKIIKNGNKEKKGVKFRSKLNNENKNNKNSKHKNQDIFININNHLIKFRKVLS